MFFECMGGDCDDRPVEPRSPQLNRRLLAVENRHLNVHQHKCGIGGEGGSDRLLAVFDQGDVGSCALEEAADQVLIVLTILGDEHVESREESFPGLVFRGSREDRGIGRGGAHRCDEDATFSRDASHRQIPSVELREPARNREPDPGASVDASRRDPPRGPRSDRRTIPGSRQIAISPRTVRAFRDGPEALYGLRGSEKKKFQS